MRQVIDAKNKDVVLVDRISLDKIYAYICGYGVFRLVRDVSRPREVGQWYFIKDTGGCVLSSEIGHASMLDAIAAKRRQGTDGSMIFEFDTLHEFWQWALRSTKNTSNKKEFVWEPQEGEY